MTTETGIVVPKKQAVHRTPFAMRREIAVQLQRILKQKVIQPSSSLWASPIVLVQKKNGSLQVCVDYWSLKAVTKPDNFSLLRIDGMLDQLGKMKYFSTLDLYSFWLLADRMSNMSEVKAVFVTQHGLFKFHVMMPFSLINTSANFERLII